MRKTTAAPLAALAAIGLLISNLPCSAQVVRSISWEPANPVAGDHVELTVIAEYNRGINGYGGQLAFENGQIKYDILFADTAQGYNANREYTLSADLGQLKAGDYVVTIRVFLMLRLDDDGEVFDTTFICDSVVTSLTVASGQNFAFAPGWNSLSSRFNPDDANIAHLFSGLVNRGTLYLIKDQNGSFYLPERGFNGIGNWNAHQGYLLNMTSADTMPWIGSEIAPDDPIALSAGWNIVAYLPPDTIAAPDAFHNITDILKIAKNGEGEFYMPGEGFNNMRPLFPGQGYVLKVSSDVDFVWHVR